MLLTVKNSEDTIAEIKDLQDQIVNQPNKIIEYFKGWLPDIANFAINVVLSIIIYFIGTKIIDLILRLVDKSCIKIGAEEGAIKFIHSLLRILLYIVLFLIIGKRFGLDNTSMVALLGSAGIAIGLALQGSLSNFAGGILLLILKPFKIGDYIIEQSTGNEGTVTNIDVFYTKVLTADNKMIAMPNGNVINSSITNVTNEDVRRLDIVVGISYESDLKKAKKIIEDMLLQDSARIEERDLNVYVSDLAESSVIIGGRMWVKTEDYWPARWRIIENIKLTFDKNDIMIPFKQLDVNIKSNNIKTEL
ncbi:small conductance mechanosensitive channel [Lachnotalea glycerini]|uniref:Mechanosensitive ion channel family protein n=1 Tax=Lachnotalea glycerini TaxID=1763509 RepID=A0A255IP66_9FIRM|nr:mechanosensitive ion channel domain-containing protein [Lachnotalea glycerini]PXV96064.1 small conductance mechanosensitive channel [Lachnotalea glycerini]RDY30598.1 mechanosensitive ion channel family protein [Lachnotalea glycerini]